MAVYFWDTSALAKYYHIELGSDYVESLLQSAEHRHFVSEVTLVEMLSITAARCDVATSMKATFLCFGRCFSRTCKISFYIS